MPTSTGRLTIQQVAREAGVSTQTVSRVLNNRPDVAPETRQRVQEVIARLGYQPSAIARGLVQNRTRTLGLITADFSDYFFTQCIAGAEIEARQYGYYFMLGSSERNPQDEPEYIRLLTKRYVDGLLLARPSIAPNDPHLLGILRDNVPVVTIAYHMPTKQLPVVDIDNVDGGIQATACLIAKGHTRIAMIAGPAGWKSVDDRTLGYRTALANAGLTFDPSLVAGGDWSYASGYQAMVQLLGRAVSFSAIFCHNDQMAIGAIRALAEAGRRVPEDVEVVGYDDIPVASYCMPPLTTVRQPMRQAGALATRLLIQAIEEPGSVPTQVHLLKAELVRRGSCP